MKKCFLSLIVLFVGFISFCSSENITFDFKCSKYSCYHDYNYTFKQYINSGNVLTAGTEYNLSCDIDVNSFTWEINYQYGPYLNGNGNPIVAGEFLVLPPEGNPYIEFVFDLPNNLTYGQEFSCVLHSNTNSNTGYYTYFSPVITGLQSTLNEFIPYGLYLGIGLLALIIPFFAVKWLIKYIMGITLFPFSFRSKKGGKKS